MSDFETVTSMFLLVSILVKRNCPLLSVFMESLPIFTITLGIPCPVQKRTMPETTNPFGGSMRYSAFVTRYLLSTVKRKIGVFMPSLQKLYVIVVSCGIEFPLKY